MSRLALGLTQPPTEWVPRIRQPGHEGDHLLQSCAEIKNVWSYISICLHGMVLNEAQDIITFLAFKSQIRVARILKTQRQEPQQSRKAMESQNLFLYRK